MPDCSPGRLAHCRGPRAPRCCPPSATARAQAAGRLGRSQRGRGRRGRYFCWVSGLRPPGQQPTRRSSRRDSHTPAPAPAPVRPQEWPDVSQGVLRRTSWEEPDSRRLPSDTSRCPVPAQAWPAPFPTAVREAWSRRGLAAVSPSQPGAATPPPTGDTPSLDPDQREATGGRVRAGRVGTSPTSGAGLMGGTGTGPSALSWTLGPGSYPEGHTQCGAPGSSRAQEGAENQLWAALGLNTQCNSQERSGSSPHQAPRPCEDAATPGLPQGAAQLDGSVQRSSMHGLAGGTWACGGPGSAAGR